MFGDCSDFADGFKSRDIEPFIVNLFSDEIIDKF
jgi:hypothetical protein